MDPKISKLRREWATRLKALSELNEKNIDVVLRADERPEFETWLTQQRAAFSKSSVPQWSALELVRAASKEKALLTAQSDGSLLVSGNLPEADVYTIETHTDLKGVTAVRLELLPDASLPFNGPGRQTENGNLAPDRILR